MNKQELTTLLNDTLKTIRSEADEKHGWQAIIKMYENALRCLPDDKCFSVSDASRIYLDFNSNYSSDIFKLMNETSLAVDQYHEKEFEKIKHCISCPFCGNAYKEAPTLRKH